MKKILLALSMLTIAGQATWCANHLGEYGNDDDHREAMNECLERYGLDTITASSSLFQHPRIVVTDVTMMKQSLWARLTDLVTAIDRVAPTMGAVGGVILHVTCSVPPTITAIFAERRLSEVGVIFPAMTLEDHESRLIGVGLAEPLLLVDIQLWSNAAGKYINMGDDTVADEMLYLPEQQHNRKQLQACAESIGLVRNTAYGWRFSEKAA